MASSVKTILVASSALFALNMTTPAIAFDQPWNGNREDITGHCQTNCKPPPPPCPSGNCKCPPNGTTSPVYAADGSLVWTDSDITFPVTTRVGLNRTYNSFDYRAGLFGRGWVTSQEVNIARTYRAVTEGNADGSPKTATEFESVPIWLASYGRRYVLQETATECTPSEVLFFTFEKQADGTFKQVFEDRQSFSIYSENGTLLQEYSDDYGTTIYYEYDAQNRLIRQVDNYGFALNFAYNDQGFVAQVTDQSDRVWNYTYDEFGRLTQVTNPDGNTKDYSYQIIDNVGYKEHLLTQINDNGDDPALSVTWSDVAIGSTTRPRVTSYTESDGHRHDYTYSSTTFNGLIAVRVVKDTKQVSSNTTVERQTFTADLDTYQIVQDINNTDNITQNSTYDERGNVLTETDERGNLTRYEYNDAGRVIRRTDLADTTDEKIITFSYFNNSNRVSTMSEYGVLETRYTYDNDLRMLTEAQVDLSSGQQRVTTYTYYPNTTDSQGNTVLGKVASIDGPLPGTEDTTTYKYNTAGLLTQITMPLNQSISYTYNTTGQAATETDVNGVVTEFSYNSRNYLTRTLRNGRSLSYEYDSQNQIVSIIDQLGRVTTFEYDTQNRIDRINESSGNYIDIDYIYTANNTEVIRRYYNTNDELIISDTTRYDTISHQPIASFLGDQPFQVSEIQRNAFDDVTQQTLFGQYGTQTSSLFRYSYDAEGKLTQITDGENGNTNYTYDVFDRLTEVSDPNNALTEYQYNAWGDLLEISSPDSGVTNFQVDVRGNVASETNANNQLSQYLYDAKNRLVGIDYAGENLDVVMNYDEGTFGVGLLTSVTDGSGGVQYQYDDRGLITDVNSNIAGVNFNNQYQFDNAEEITNLTYPSGMQVSLEYDVAGRLSDITLNQNGIDTVLLNNIEWYGPNLGRHQRGNGLITDFFYDTAGRLIEKRFGGESERLQNQLDNQGQIIQQTWVRNDVQDVNPFQYDRLGRLVRDGAAEDDIDWLFGYDPVGNRLSQQKSDNSENISYEYEANSNLLSQFDSTVVQIDSAGNTLNDGFRQYKYDAMNRLSIVTNNQNGIEASYTYNYMGHRARKQLSGSQQIDIRYVYGQEGELLGEYNATGSRIREYIYYIEGESRELIAQIESDGSIHYIHTDHLMTPRLATNQNQEVVWRWKGEAFGVGGIDEDPDSDGNSLVINHRFPGQHYDLESELFYNWNRYYDPQHGRYITTDPIGLSGGLNTFAYANLNPLKYTDPEGLFPPAIIIGLRIGGAAAKAYMKLPCVIYALVDCKGKTVYVGISKNIGARWYGHNSKRGVVGKFGCQKKCPVAMVPIGGYKARFSCIKKEKQLISKRKPIWNTQHNKDPNKGNKRNIWKKNNCDCK